MYASRRGFLRGLVAAAAATTLPFATRNTPTAKAEPVRPASHAHVPALRLQPDNDWSEILPPERASRRNRSVVTHFEFASAVGAVHDRARPLVTLRACNA